MRIIRSMPERTCTDVSLFERPVAFCPNDAAKVQKRAEINWFNTFMKTWSIIPTRLWVFFSKDGDGKFTPRPNFIGRKQEWMSGAFPLTV